MRKLLDVLLSVYEIPLKIVLRCCGNDIEKNILRHFIRKLNLNHFYTQVKFYPKKASELNQYHGTGKDFSDCAIILQGPIVMEDDFTLETIKLYRSYYSKVNIIVSTWENCDVNFEKEIDGLQVKLIKSKYPNINGVGNINYQIVSSLNGVEYAEELNVDYIWKTRTDQRYYHPFALDYLKNKIAMTPNKVVCLGGIRNSFVNRYFQLSDFMLFGNTKNVKAYYSCPLDNEDSKTSKYTRKNQNEKLEYYNQYLKAVKQAEIDGRICVENKFDDCSVFYCNPEVMLHYGYYCNVSEIQGLDSYKEKYRDFLKNYVDIVDAEIIGFFWKKYELEFMCENYFERIGKLDSIRYVVESEKG